MVKKIVTFILQLIVSLGIILLLLYIADIEKVIEIIAHSDMNWLILAFIFYLAINLVMSFRIFLILRKFGIKIHFFDVLSSHFAGMLASDFTPARTGYFTTAFALTNNHKVPLEQSIVSILGPQIFDFLLKLIIGVIGIWWIISFYLAGNLDKVIGILIGIGMIGGIIIFSTLLLFSEKFINQLKIITKLPFGIRIYELLCNMQKNSKVIKDLFGTIIILLFISWMFKGLEWWCIAQSLHIHIDIPFPQLIFYLFLQPLLTLLQFVPSPTLAGIGLSEAGAVGIFAVFMPLEQAIAQGVIFTLLTRFVMIAMDLVGIREIIKLIFRSLKN